MNIVNSSLKKQFLSLYFNSDYISMVRVEDGLIKSVASRELVQPINMDLFRIEGELLGSQLQTVKDLYKRSGGGANEVGVAINVGMVLIKKIPVAMGLDQDVVREQLDWETEQVTIDPLADYIIGYERLPFHTPEGNPFFLVILVRKSVVKSIRLLIERTGLVLKDIDVDVFSNIRTVVANYSLNPDKTSVLVDFQKEYMNFVFIQKNEFLSTHSISTKESGLGSEYTDGSEHGKVLLKELRRLVFGHRLGQGIEDLGSIFLTGNESVRMILKEISNSVPVTVCVVDPFKKIQVSKLLLESNELNKFPERFVASVGVVLKKIPVLAERADQAGTGP